MPREFVPKGVTSVSEALRSAVCVDDPGEGPLGVEGQMFVRMNLPASKGRRAVTLYVSWGGQIGKTEA